MNTNRNRGFFLSLLICLGFSTSAFASSVQVKITFANWATRAAGEYIEYRDEKLSKIPLVSIPRVDSLCRVAPFSERVSGQDIQILADLKCDDERINPQQLNDLIPAIRSELQIDIVPVTPPGGGAGVRN